MPLTLVTPPSIEPVSLAEAKAQCLVDASVCDQDLYLDQILIPAARERAEQATDRALLRQTWDLVLDAFPCDGWLEIPKPPLVSVTSVTYRDAAGAIQVWPETNYIVLAPSGPRCLRGRLALAVGASWPSTYGQAGDITIRFVCGAATVAGVSALIRSAILADVSELYTNRENPVPTYAGDVYIRFRSPATQRRTG